MELAELVRQQALENGPLSFKDYMEMALYHPEQGYYMAENECIGKKGDFYTSCCLGPVFGAMIAKQLKEMWEVLNEQEFTVVEYGAGTGALCRHILDYFRDYTSLYDRLHYVIIEKSPVMRQKEQTLLPSSVRWCQKLEELGEFNGCVLSNELLDNFAVHQVVMQDELMEVFVDGELKEALLPAGNVLKDYFTDINVSLPCGFRTEVNLEAVSWIADIARFLQKGYVMTIDYGYLSEDLYHDRRRGGTLLCYHDHQLSERYYDHIGKQDITAHVNFSALCHWGHQNGLACCGLTSQAHFLLSLDFKQYLRQLKTTGGDILQLALEEVRLTRTLLIDMGSKFKVLIQGKNVPGHVLTGLNPEPGIN